LIFLQTGDTTFGPFEKTGLPYWYIDFQNNWYPCYHWDVA